jgi:hypothetical protein
MFIYRHRSGTAAVPTAAPHAVRKNDPAGWEPARTGHRGWLRVAAVGAAVPLAAVVTAAGAQAAVGPEATAVTGTRASLTAVTAIPGSSGAWAVGQKCPRGPEGCVPGNDEILQESGGAWSQVPAPSPGGQASLTAVSAGSASDAWAVGSYDGGEKDLYLHWTGSAWHKVNGPTPDGSALTGVAVISPDDVLAVGDYTSPSGARATLSLHWNGRTWAKVATPDPAASSGDDELHAVTTAPGSRAWAVGYYLDAQSTTKTLILRWNGTAWSQVSAPAVATLRTQLSGVADSGQDVWAAGQYYSSADVTHPLILQWNGTRWSRQILPPAGPDNATLNGVAATGSDVWAVGFACVGPSANCPSKVLTVHLTSSGWQEVPGVSLSDRQDQNTLNGVGIAPGPDVWAVGDYFPVPVDEPIFALLEQQRGSGWVTR